VNHHNHSSAVMRAHNLCLSYRFNARHHLHAVMNRTEDSCRLGATDRPISMLLRRQGSSDTKGNTEGPNKSGTLVFAHRTADSGDTNFVFRDEGISDNAVFSALEKSLGRVA